MNRINFGIASLALLVASSFANAVPVTYTVSAFADGSLGGSSFTGQIVTVTATGDTSGVHIFSFNEVSKDVVLSGVAVTINVGQTTASLTGLGEVFARSSPILDGVEDLGIEAAGQTIFGTRGPFTTYQLTTSIGPSSDIPLFSPGTEFPTDQGSFEMTTIIGHFSTFTATVAPEPATTAMFGLGLFGLAALKRWK